MGDALPRLGTSPTSSCGTSGVSMSRSPTPEKQEIPVSAVVWAKMKGFPAWPARVIDPKANDLNPKIRKEAQKSPPNSHFVRFYGTHDFSWVLSSDILWPFERHAHLESAAKKKGRKQLLKAIEEAKLCLDQDSVDNAVDAVNHNNNNDHYSSKLDGGDNNVSAKTPRKKSSDVSKRVDDLDDSSNDSNNGLVIDTSTSSSFSGDVKAEVKSESSSVSSFSNAISKAAKNAVVAAAAARNDPSSAAKVKPNSPISVSVGRSSTPIIGIVSPMRSASATLSFDLKSVMNGIHSPPKPSVSSPSLSPTLQRTPPPSGSTTTTTMKRKSPMESATDSKKFKTENGVGEEEDVPIEDEDASIQPEEEEPIGVGDAAEAEPETTKTTTAALEMTTTTVKPPEVKLEAGAPDDQAARQKGAKTQKSSAPKGSNGKEESAAETRDDVKPNIDQNDGGVDSSGRARLSSSGGNVAGGGVASGEAQGKNLNGKKSSKKQKESELSSHSCSVKVRKLSSSNLKTETPASPRKDRNNPPAPPSATPPPPLPQCPDEGKSECKTPVKSSPTKNRISSPKCISPLGRPYPNQKTSVSYHEHFQDWMIEDYSNVTKLFSKPGTYIQGRKFLVREDVWVLRLYPCGDTGEKGDPNFVGVFVELVSRPPKDIDNDVKAVLKISILNKDKSKVWGEEMAAYTAHALSFSTIKEKKRNVMGYAQFISRDTLFKHKDLFLPDGNLTLGVKLVVLGEVTTKVMTTARPFTNATVTATDFAGLIDDPIFSDFSITVEGKTIRAHKAILSARSSYFRDMFLRRQADINSFDSINLEDASYRILHDVLLFIYSGYSSILKDKPFDLAVGSEAAAAEAAECAVDDDRLRVDSLRQLAAAAEKYQIPELKTKAENELARIEPLLDS